MDILIYRLRRSNCLVLARFAIASMCFVAFGPNAIAQQQRAITTTFDVASIRPFKLNENVFERTINNNPHLGSFRAKGVTLKVLLHLAYGLQENQIQGGPEWLNEDLYEVEAKSDSTVDEQLQKMSDEDAKKSKQHMLQALLAERFNLKVHVVMVDGLVYALTIAKNGSKLHPSEPVAAGTDPKSPFTMQFEGGTMVFTRASLSFFVHLLSEQTQRNIVDKTGLTGLYDFKLRFQMRSPGTDLDEKRADSDPNTPDLEGALEEQLGLMLKKQKGPLETLVVDSITKPSPN